MREEAISSGFELPNARKCEFSLLATDEASFFLLFLAFSFSPFLSELFFGMIPSLRSSASNIERLAFDDEIYL